MPFLDGPSEQIRKEYVGIGVVVTAVVAASFVMGLRVGFQLGLQAVL